MDVTIQKPLFQGFKGAALNAMLSETLQCGRQFRLPILPEFSQSDVVPYLYLHAQATFWPGKY